jgi:hypothetical protein
VPQQQIDSVRNEIRNQLRTAITEAQLSNVTASGNQTVDEVIQARVWALLEGNIRGDRPVIPLGPISYSLREQYGAQIFDRAIPEVIQKVEQQRAQNPIPQPGVLPPAQPGQQPPAGQQPPPSSTNQ